MDNPGSPEAVTKGCICPILDNSSGKGYMGMTNVFSINLDCFLHGKTPCVECGEHNDNSKANFPTCSKCINEKMTGGAD